MILGRFNQPSISVGGFLFLDGIITNVMFDKIKQLNELRKQSQQMQKDLEAEVLEVEHRGVKVTVSAAMKINSLISNGRPDEDVAAAVNRALQEAQKIAAKKMRSQLGNLGLDLPGM